MTTIGEIAQKYSGHVAELQWGDGGTDHAHTCTGGTFRGVLRNGRFYDMMGYDVHGMAATDGAPSILSYGIFLNEFPLAKAEFLVPIFEPLSNLEEAVVEAIRANQPYAQIKIPLLISPSEPVLPRQHRFINCENGLWEMSRLNELPRPCLSEVPDVIDLGVEIYRVRVPPIPKEFLPYFGPSALMKNIGKNFISSQNATSFEMSLLRGLSEGKPYAVLEVPMLFRDEPVAGERASRLAPARQGSENTVGIEALFA